MLFDYDDTEWLTKCIWEFSVVVVPGSSDFKYARAQIHDQIPFNNAQSVHGEHGVRAQGADHDDAQKGETPVFRRNQQL